MAPDSRRKSEKRRVYQNWQVSEARRKLKLRAVLYKGGKCALCGYNKCLGALVFHHTDSSRKEFQICSIIRKWETIRTELDKTVLLCANCHHELHYAEAETHRKEITASVRRETPARTPLYDHGTSRGYRLGCRCAECRAWNAQKQRRYQQEKKSGTPDRSDPDLVRGGCPTPAGRPPEGVQP